MLTATRYARHADFLDAVVRAVAERRSLMYSPCLDESLVKTLYRLKRVWKKPMTEITNLLLQKSLDGMDKECVCPICINEKNNDCASCYFSRGS
jgi:hypothetical protein